MQLNDQAVLDGRMAFDETPFEPVLTAEEKQKQIDKEAKEGEIDCI